MSRLRRQDRLSNDEFYVAMMRKLGLPFWTTNTAPRCRSGGRVDIYGDSFFSKASYTKPNKRRAHDSIRDCLHTILERLTVTAHYAPNKDSVFSEETGLIDAVPNRRPLDVSFNIDKAHLATSTGRSTLDKFGLDVTLISFEPHSSSTATRTPEENRIHAHRTGERMKLVGEGYTNKRTKVTISRDQALKALHEKNIALCPFTIDHFGSLGERGRLFLFGHSHNDPPLPLNIDSTTHPNAALMDSIICGGGAPVGFLHQATRTWRDNLPPKTRTRHYGGSYLSPTPAVWAEQQLGLGITKSLAQMCLTGMKMATDHSFKPNKIPKRRPKNPTRPQDLNHTNTSTPPNPKPAHQQTPHPQPTTTSQTSPTSLPTPPLPRTSWHPLPSLSPIWTPTDVLPPSTPNPPPGFPPQPHPPRLPTLGPPPGFTQRIDDYVYGPLFVDKMFMDLANDDDIATELEKELLDDFLDRM